MLQLCFEIATLNLMALISLEKGNNVLSSAASLVSTFLSALFYIIFKTGRKTFSFALPLAANLLTQIVLFDISTFEKLAAHFSHHVPGHNPCKFGYQIDCSVVGRDFDSCSMSFSIKQTHKTNQEQSLSVEIQLYLRLHTVK